MVNNAAADPATQAYRNTMEGMFSNKGVNELAPPPRFDYRGYDLKWDEVDKLVERITDALIKIEDKTGRFRYQLADGRIIDSITWNFWEWPQAIGLNGLFDYYVLTSSLDPDSNQAARTLKILKDWFQARHEEGTTTKNINTMSVLYSVACLVELDEQRGGAVLTEAERERFKGWMEDWAEWVMNDLPMTFRLPNVNQLWDDTLMMTAKYQFHIHIQYLMDSASGLWYHGWEFDGRGSGHNYAKALWGRGNCWATLAIPMFLDLVKLPSNDATHRHLLATLQRQVDGLLPLQDAETGLWRTLLDDPTSYVETSASAGFVGGILMGIRLGYLDKDRYLQPALNGLKGCIAQVQESGEVANVSKGTPVSMDKDFYKTIPRVPVPYGQSLLIVALGEWLRLAELGIVSK